jgi:exopolysaccharide biosynthesis protein
MVVYKGKVYYAESGVRLGFVGLDKNHIMHVGNLYPGAVRERGIQYGVAFGPVLVANGEMTAQAKQGSGVNPRTAIGQRSDGAILMLVIDGRQASSLGATYADMINVLMEYEAFNAANLDGGSSSMLWYNGEYINKGVILTGSRELPTAFIVR